MNIYASDISKEKEYLIKNLIFLLKVRQNNLVIEKEEKIKNSKPDIERINSTIVITLQGKKFYLTIYEYGFKIESNPHKEEEIFEIKCSRDDLEYHLYCIFLDFMKELFGTKILRETIADIRYDFENKAITIPSDSKPNEYMDLIYDDENKKIIIKLRTKKEIIKCNNRLTFDWDCSLYNSYSSFRHLFDRLIVLGGRQEQQGIRIK